MFLLIVFPLKDPTQLPTWVMGLPKRIYVLPPHMGFEEDICGEMRFHVATYSLKEESPMKIIQQLRPN